MDFVVTGGGTAGHINPALALCDELGARGHSLHFAGTPTGVEARLVAQAGLEFTSFEASGFNRKHPLSMVKALRLVASSAKRAEAWLSEVKPGCVVCFGGYVSVPVGRAAASLGIPVVVHEQNSVMGLANKYLSKRAARVALTYASAGVAVGDKDKVVLTGNPVRRSIFDATRSQGRVYAEVPDDARFLVVFGGSLGAKRLNEAVCSLKEQLLSREDLHVRHVTGPNNYEEVLEALALAPEQQQRWKVVSYENRMGEVLAACDMVLSRAGATSLAEISALKIPALLVPYPFATADHQTSNASEYVAAGAAYMVADSEVDSPGFSEKLFQMLDDGDLRESMAKAAEGFRTQDAASALCDLVLEVASGDALE